MILVQLRQILNCPIIMRRISVANLQTTGKTNYNYNVKDLKADQWKQPAFTPPQLCNGLTEQQQSSAQS